MGARRNGTRPAGPLVSVITPLHAAGNAFVAEAWQSLRRQTYAHWEWLVLTNHGGVLPAEITRDARVRTWPAPPDLQGVGALKQACCQQAAGAIFLELDADDLLTPDALADVVAALGAGADVVYSDFAEFHHGTWAPNTYSADFGWASYPMTYAGHALVAMAAPPVTPQNLRYVDWAPNHVRAWTRAAYAAVGGHDRALPFADDHDLLCRGYLAGQRIERIPRPLYLYRVHGGNAVATRNAEIRQWTEAVYNRHVWPLAVKGARDAGLACVDLCGGLDPAPGFVPLDVTPTPGGIVADLRGRWPLADSSVGVLRAHDALEHIPDKIHVFNEAWRVLAPGGWFLSMTPSALGQGAFQDPTHCAYYVKNSFLYVTDPAFARYVPALTARFAESRVQEIYPSQWHRDNACPYIEAHLICLKDRYAHMGGQRWPR